MKKLFIFGGLVYAAELLASNLFVQWTNGENPIGAVTHVYYGVQPGIYTNFVQVPYGATNVIISNVVSGVRYYVAAKHSDGVDESVFSNEDNSKTKLNPPKNLTATAQ